MLERAWRLSRPRKTLGARPTPCITNTYALVHLKVSLSYKDQQQNRLGRLNQSIHAWAEMSRGNTREDEEQDQAGEGLRSSINECIGRETSIGGSKTCFSAYSRVGCSRRAPSAPSRPTKSLHPVSAPRLDGTLDVTNNYIPLYLRRSALCPSFPSPSPIVCQSRGNTLTYYSHTQSSPVNCITSTTVRHPVNFTEPYRSTICLRGPCRCNTLPEIPPNRFDDVTPAPRETLRSIHIIQYHHHN
jgi:hypothetical protein